MGNVNKTLEDSANIKLVGVKFSPSKQPHNDSERRFYKTWITLRSAEIKQIAKYLSVNIE